MKKETFKVVTHGRCPTDSLADKPACAVIEIDGRGIAQLAGLYAKAREAEALGVEEISAWPVAGLAVRWTDGISESDMAGASASGLPASEEWLADNFLGDEGSGDWNESSGEDSVEAENIVVDPEGFLFRGRGAHSDNLFESGHVRWGEVPGLTEAVEEALRRPPATFPDLDWNRAPADGLPALPPPPPPGVAFVLVQQNEYGTDIQGFTTREAAEADLRSYLADNWLHRADADAPDDPADMPLDKALEAYFDGNPKESYAIEEIRVGMPSAVLPHKVFVLLQEDGAERTANVFPTYDLAEEFLRGYVAGSWDSRADRDAPQDMGLMTVEQALEAYFDRNEDENYTILEVEPTGFGPVLGHEPSPRLAVVFSYESGRPPEVNLCRSQEEAEKILYDLAIEDWGFRGNQEAPENPSTLSREQVVGAYFEENPHLSYNIVAPNRPDPLPRTEGGLEESQTALVLTYPDSESRVVLCASRQDAEQHLYDLASDNWEFRADRGAPDDLAELPRDRVISGYFDGNPHVSYSIGTPEVAGAQGTRPAASANATEDPPGLIEDEDALPSPSM